MRRAASLALLALVACEGAERASTVLRLGGPTMGTSWQVQVGLHELAPDARGPLRASLIRAIEAELRAVNAEMSTYQKDSEISRFGASRSTEWFSVSPGFAHVVLEALAIGRASGGAFDITIAPVVDAWGFGAGKSERREAPRGDALAAARARVDASALEVRLEPPALRKRRPDLALDLSAIAKGHGVDRVGELLDERGLRRWWVEIGGEVRTRGEKAPGTPWRVAIERPLEHGREALLALPIQDEALASSGDYRNFALVEGERVSHIINPASGAPVGDAVAQVSVWAPRCATADAWATTLMVLGPERGMELALAQKLPVLMLVRSESGLRELRSPAFEERTRGAQPARRPSKK